MSKGDIALLPRDARHHETLMSFLEYCRTHPEERFWQALRNWSGYQFIFAHDSAGDHDTFYLEGRNHNDN